MKTPNPDVDSFIEALRGDLPSADDDARVRSRLLGAGVLVTSAAVTTSGAATAASGVAVTGTALGGTALGGAALGAQVAGTAGAPLVLVKAGLVSKLLMLPVAAKVGVATTLALAVAATGAPLIVSRMESPAVVAPKSHALPSSRVTASNDLARRAPSNSALHAAPSDSAPHAAPSGNAGPVAPVSVQPAQPRRQPTPSTPEHREAVRRPGSVAREPAPAEPVASQRVRASSLAEETRLMEQAMLAVGAGQQELARRWLDEHTRRFPEGLLARERERALARLPRAGDPAQTSSP